MTQGVVPFFAFHGLMTRSKSSRPMADRCTRAVELLTTVVGAAHP